MQCVRRWMVKRQWAPHHTNWCGGQPLAFSYAASTGKHLKEQCSTARQMEITLVYDTPSHRHQIILKLLASMLFLQLGNAQAMLTLTHLSWRSNEPVRWNADVTSEIVNVKQEQDARLNRGEHVHVHDRLIRLCLWSCLVVNQQVHPSVNSRWCCALSSPHVRGKLKPNACMSAWAKTGTCAH